MRVPYKHEHQRNSIKTNILVSSSPYHFGLLHLGKEIMTIFFLHKVVYHHIVLTLHLFVVRYFSLGTLVVNVHQAVK